MAILCLQRGGYFMYWATLGYEESKTSELRSLSRTEVKHSSHCVLLPGDAAPDGGRPGPASLQQPERNAGEGGGDLDLLPVQSANRPRGGSPAGRTEDQMLRYTGITGFIQLSVHCTSCIFRAWLLVRFKRLIEICMRHLLHSTAFHLPTCLLL